jgi:hypothetical protein
MHGVLLLAGLGVRSVEEEVVLSLVSNHGNQKQPRVFRHRAAARQASK